MKWYRVPLLSSSQGCQLSLTRAEFFLPHLNLSVCYFWSWVWRVNFSKPGYVCLHPPLQNCEWQDQQFQKHHAQQTCNKNIEIFQFLRQNVNNLWNLSMAGNFKVLLLSSLRKAFIFSSILHLNFSFSAFCLSSSLASYSLRKPINWDACHLTQRIPSFSSSSFSLFPRVGLALTCPWIPWCCG